MDGTKPGHIIVTIQDIMSDNFRYGRLRAIVKDWYSRQEHNRRKKVQSFHEDTMVKNTPIQEDIDTPTTGQRNTCI